MVIAATPYLPISLKVKKSHKFITTVKHLFHEEYLNYFYLDTHNISNDILSEKYIEDSVPITTTPFFT